jgi:hypothetical protein
VRRPRGELLSVRRKALLQSSKMDNLKEKTMNYSPEVFARLVDIEVARQAVPENEDKIASLGEVICQYGLADVVGVSLLHRHFDLRDNERLVTNYVGTGWSAEPEVVSDNEVKPFIWKLERNDMAGSWEWVPIEFFRTSSLLADEETQSDTVSSSVDFLNAMAARVVELGVQDNFGISLLMDRDHKEGFIYFEKNNREARTMNASLVPEMGRDAPGGITLWNFKELARNGGEIRFAKGCAHGNSRHCCGS